MVPMHMTQDYAIDIGALESSESKTGDDVGLAADGMARFYVAENWRGVGGERGAETKVEEEVGWGEEGGGIGGTIGDDGW